MNKQLMDLECYTNYFCCGIKELNSPNRSFFEISEEHNDLQLIYDWFTGFNGFLITFNGINYDEPLIKYLIKNYNRYLDLHWLDVCKDLKRFSDKIIEDSFEDEVKNIRYIKSNWISIDLFLYWSKGLRISKQLSLKSLAIQLNYHTIQELPFCPSSYLTIENLPKLRHYNSVHDLGVLELLCNKMDSDIKLRGNINNQYKLDCWSWDAPRIASEALLQDYCKITNSNLNDTRRLRFEKPLLHLNECLKGFDPNFKLPIFKQLWNDILLSKNSFSKDLLVSYNNTNIILTYGIGGLHSVNKNEQYYSNDTHQIVTSDVASMYPNIIMNYLCIRFLKVINKYKQFAKDKKDGKLEKNKPKETFSKLILNSTSGLLDNEYSWLYYPEGAMRLRLIGQLILTKCIEICLINNWQVISANTDGIEVIVPIEELDTYKKILDDTSANFQLSLEHECYNKIFYKNVNNYICETKDGKLKQKGLFVHDVLLGNSTDELVIAKALEAYFINNIQPEEFINNPDKYNISIFDYCKSDKVSKQYTVYHNGQVQQRLNRYYFSKTGPYLYKKKFNKTTLDNMNVGEGVMLYNNHCETEQNGYSINPKYFAKTDSISQNWKNYKINYQYYIRKTNEIILKMNNLNQLSLF